MASNPRFRPAARAKYWRRNLRILALLLTIWFVISFRAGILLAEPLNRIRIQGPAFRWGSGSRNGLDLRFRAAVFAYVALMRRLDREHGYEERE
jgi:putative solute:sodium symporter small subunit